MTGLSIVSVLRDSLQVPLRVPFTFVLLAAVIVVAIWTEASKEALTADWLNRLGFATTDLWSLDLERLATSAVVTHGGPVFWRALVSIAVIVGTAEWKAGTLRTGFVFSVCHSLTLIGLAAFVGYGLRSWHPPMADLLSSARDVGPSAGYFGCLALWCRSWPRPLKTIAAPSIAFGLTIVAVTAAVDGQAPAASISAALAHAVAFPVGWLLSAGADRFLAARRNSKQITAKHDGSDA